MKKQDLATEANTYFEQLGLNDVVEELSEKFSQAYMIPGEETYNLKEALQRASDFLLDKIYEKIHGSKPEDLITRQQKEEILYKDIPGFFESRFFLLDIEKIKLLLRIMNNHPIDMMETIKALEAFAVYGWIFYFLDSGGCFPVMPKEIADILITIKTPEVLDHISFIGGIRLIINACLNLYGVCTMEQIQNILLTRSDKEDKTDCKNMCQTIQKLLPYLEEQHMLWQDGPYIISPFLETPQEYKALLRIQNKDYHIPDPQLFNCLGSGKLLVKNKEYETVFHLLNREIRDQEQTEEMLEEISGYVTKEDWTIPQIMNLLYTWDVAFSSDQSAKRMIEALCQWTYGIHRWSAGGHSRKGLGKENEDLKYLLHMDHDKNDKAAKVYPNDPCPCGSGKKYKKCCGRK